jgi:hypothetical protein
MFRSTVYATFSLVLLCLSLSCQSLKDWRSPVRILPQACEVEQGCPLQFKAVKGSSLPSGLRWELSSGSAGKINETGLFNASFAPGKYEVRVCTASGKVLARTEFKVTPATHYLATSNFAEIFDPATGLIQPTGSMARARSGHAAVLLSDGRVLVTGGIYNSSERDHPSEAEVFDPKTGTFALMDPQPLIQRDGHAALSLPGDRVALVGGVPYGDYRSVGKVFEIYDPKQKKVQAQQLETRTGLHLEGALTLKDGSVLLWGRGIELWEPAFRRIVTLSCDPVPGPGASGCQLDDGRVMITGGFVEYGGGARVPQALAWLVDPKERAVKVFPTTGSGRFGHFSFALGKDALLVGGTIRETLAPMIIQDPSGQIIPIAQGRLLPAQSLEVVSLEGGSTTQVTGDIPSEWGLSILVKSNTVLLAGGRETPLTDAFVLDAITNISSRITPMKIKRKRHTLTQLKDGRILILGGETTYN